MECQNIFWDFALGRKTKQRHFCLRPSEQLHLCPRHEGEKYLSSLFQNVRNVKNDLCIFTTSIILLNRDLKVCWKSSFENSRVWVCSLFSWERGDNILLKCIVEWFVQIVSRPGVTLMAALIVTTINDTRHNIAFYDFKQRKSLVQSELCFNSEREYEPF